MATRRMFSQEIVSNDSFLDMPMSAQALYFHLGMYADDDGFVSPQKVLRMVGANPDDLKVLLAKSFLIRFENGIIVVKHWKQNNYIQKDRYRATIFTKELNSLSCIQNVYNLDAQVGREVGREVIGDSLILEDIRKSVKDKLRS